MNFERECAQMIQKYLKEVKSQDLTIDQIMERPRWKRVWFWWIVLEHYEGKPMPNLSLDVVKDVYGE